MNNPYMPRHRDDSSDDAEDGYEPFTYRDPTAVTAIRNLTRRERPRPYGPRWQPPRTR